MKHAATSALFAYWNELRGARMTPERSEIDPAAIRHVLADTFMIDVENDGSHPFRLAGTRICALFGRELKDMPFSNLWRSPDSPIGVEGDVLVRAVCDEQRAAVAGVMARTEGGHELDLEMLLLPLRHRGRTHSRVLGCLSPAAMPLWFGLDPVEVLTLMTFRVVMEAPESVDAEAVAFGGSSLVGNRRGHLRVYEGGLTT